MGIIVQKKKECTPKRAGQWMKETKGGWGNWVGGGGGITSGGGRGADKEKGNKSRKNNIQPGREGAKKRKST